MNCNNALTTPLARFAPFAPVLAVTLLAMLGCIKREETIAVLPDGSAFLAGYFEGDPEDIREGDALPTEQSGWTVNERLKSESDKKKSLQRTATKKIAANTPLPDSYASPGKPVTDICLRFPTTITVEHRPEGVYYHFRRVYEGRRYAQFIFWQKTIFESDDFQKLSNKSPEELTDEERVQLAKAFITIDTRKTSEFIDDAALSLADRLPQDAWLAARQEAIAVYCSDFTQQRLVEMLKSEDGSQEALQLADETREAAVASLSEALRRKDTSPALIAEFLDAYQRSRDEFDATEDLGDESWSVTAVLPGTIVGHGGFDASTPDVDDDYGRNPATHAVDKVLKAAHFEPGFGRVRWEFDGSRLADRDVVLAATSFVPRGK